MRRDWDVWLMKVDYEKFLKGEDDEMCGGEEGSLFRFFGS